MRFVSFLSSVLFGFSVYADPVQLSIGFGGSVPKSDNVVVVEKAGPSRANGGEHILMKFSGPKAITDIKMTAYSAGHAGKVQIHSVVGTNGSTKTPFPTLAIMLPDTASVETAPNAAFTQIEIVAEGFTNNDASLLLQVTTTDRLNAIDYLVTRTGSSETVGSAINESSYAKFTPANLQALMEVGGQPTADDLVGKTFVCSSYSKLNPTQVDMKTRNYYVVGTALVSDSSAEGSNVLWTQTEDGLGMSAENHNGCGRFTTKNVIRKTGGGNLVSEVVVDLEAYVQLCIGAGYDGDATRAVEANSTFSSLISPKYVVNAYEFCKVK